MRPDSLPVETGGRFAVKLYATFVACCLLSKVHNKLQYFKSTLMHIAMCISRRAMLLRPRTVCPRKCWIMRPLEEASPYEYDPSLMGGISVIAVLCTNIFPPSCYPFLPPPFSDTPVNKPCMSSVHAPTCTSDRCLGYEWLSLRGPIHTEIPDGQNCHQFVISVHVRGHKSWLTNWTYTQGHNCGCI